VIGQGSRIARASRVAARVVDGKAVIVVIDSRELHTLNEVGTFVWEALGEDRVRTVGELVDAVEAEFEVERARAAEDVARFVGEMHALGVVRVEEVVA
jgi:hypothetical protein